LACELEKMGTDYTISIKLMESMLTSMKEKWQNIDRKSKALSKIGHLTDGQYVFSNHLRLLKICFLKLNYIVLLYNELNCTIFSFIIYFLVIELKLFNGRSCSNDEDHDSELEKIDKRELKSLADGIWEKLDNFNWQNPDKEIPELKSQMAGLLFLLK
jgi:hypothetical protein